MNVHVITSSRHGSTAEVGQAIANRLVERGLAATACDADGAADAIAPDDAVVIGSPIYMGKWLKPARGLLDQLAEEPEGRDVYVFSLGPIGDPPEPVDSSPEPDVEAFAAARARGSRIFADQLLGAQKPITEVASGV